MWQWQMWEGGFWVFTRGQTFFIYAVTSHVPASQGGRLWAGLGGCKTVSCWEYAALWAMGVMWHAGLTRCPADGNNVPAEAKSRTNTDYSMMNSKWTRLYLWELSKSGHAIGQGQCSIFRRLLNLSLGYHVWITKSLHRLFNHLIMRVAAERYRNLLLCSICEDKKVKEVKLFFWFLIVR